MLRAALLLTHLCNLALAAHFLRESSFLLMALTLAITACLWSRARWAVVLNQLTLATGAVMWLGTAGQVLVKRLDQGRPYVRMLWILATVAVLALVTAALWLVPIVHRTWTRTTRLPAPPAL